MSINFFHPLINVRGESSGKGEQYHTNNQSSATPLTLKQHTLITHAQSSYPLINTNCHIISDLRSYKFENEPARCSIEFLFRPSEDPRARQVPWGRRGGSNINWWRTANKTSTGPLLHIIAGDHAGFHTSQNSSVYGRLQHAWQYPRHTKSVAIPAGIHIHYNKHRLKWKEIQMRTSSGCYNRPSETRHVVMSSIGTVYEGTMWMASYQLQTMYGVEWVTDIVTG